MSKFKFDKVSPGWHYDKFSKPEDELEHIGSINIDNNVSGVVDNILSNPYDEGGIKRVHIGNPTEDVNSSVINKRVAHMREIGYTTDNHFIEFINEKFPTLEKTLSDRYGISHYHYCAIMINPGQCMPVHDDTYSYLKKYMNRDYPDVEYDMSDIRRYCTFLTDWEWGQSFGAGNLIKGQWRKGDIFEWKHKMLHWSSNASMKPLLFYEITGLNLKDK